MQKKSFKKTANVFHRKLAKLGIHFNIFSVLIAFNFLQKLLFRSWSVTQNTQQMMRRKNITQ